jgi:hypothetical protein
MGPKSTGATPPHVATTPEDSDELPVEALLSMPECLHVPLDHGGRRALDVAHLNKDLVNPTDRCLSGLVCDVADQVPEPPVRAVDLAQLPIQQANVSSATLSEGRRSRPTYRLSKRFVIDVEMSLSAQLIHDSHLAASWRSARRWTALASLRQPRSLFD